MMTSINDFNPIVVASFPFAMTDINKFMFKNGSFYFLNGNNLYEYKNNTIISSYGSVLSFDVSNDGLVYKQSTNSPYTITGLNTNIQGSGIKQNFDLDYIDGENTIYGYEQWSQQFQYGNAYNYLKIRKYSIIDDENYSSEFIFSNSIYNPNSGLLNSYLNRYESILSVEGDYLFYNIEQNLYRIPTIGSSTHPVLIKTTPNGKNINGIFIN